MKILSKEEKAKASAACFESNKTTDKFFQTADGQCFTDEHAALQHSKEIGNSEEARLVEEVKRPAKKGKEE